MEALSGDRQTDAFGQERNANTDAEHDQVPRAEMEQSGSRLARGGRSGHELDIGGGRRSHCRRWRFALGRTRGRRRPGNR